MDLLLVALLVLAVAAVVLVALGRVGGGLVPQDTAPLEPLAGGVQEPADLDRARFQLALRGYRMDQVDGVLDEVRDLLATKDAEIARLRAGGLVAHEAPAADGPARSVAHEAPADGPVTPVANEAPAAPREQA